MKIYYQNLKYKMTYSIVMAFCLIILSIPQPAFANKYQNNANAWCANYSHLHPGIKCRVVHRGKLCPKGYMRAHKFGRIARGYKACIPGKKGTVIKQGIKKGINKIANLTPGLLLNGYRFYFKRIQRHAHGNTHLSRRFIEHYQRYYKNNLKNVVISESSEVPTNTAMTDCHHIYFPLHSSMLYIIQKGKVLNTSGSKADTKRWLLHELTHTEQCTKAGGRNNYALKWWGTTSVGTIKTILKGNYHKNIANQIHAKNPMEGAAERKAQKLRTR